MCQVYFCSCVSYSVTYGVRYVVIFFFKQKTAYEVRISDWSSDVCSSDLVSRLVPDANPAHDAVWNLGDQRKGLACADNDHSNEHDHIQDVHDGRVAAVDVVDGLGETFAHEPAEELEDDVAHEQYEKNGRASCRERVCRYV